METPEVSETSDEIPDVTGPVSEDSTWEVAGREDSPDNSELTEADSAEEAPTEVAPTEEVPEFSLEPVDSSVVPEMEDAAARDVKSELAAEDEVAFKDARREVGKSRVSASVSDESAPEVSFVYPLASK